MLCVLVFSYKNVVLERLHLMSVTFATLWCCEVCIYMREKRYTWNIDMWSAACEGTSARYCDTERVLCLVSCFLLTSHTNRRPPPKHSRWESSAVHRVFSSHRHLACCFSKHFTPPLPPPPRPNHLYLYYYYYCCFLGVFFFASVSIFFKPVPFKDHCCK